MTYRVGGSAADIDGSTGPSRSAITVMKHLSTERKIIYSLVVTLIAIQVAIFLVVRANNAHIARDALDEVIQTGALVTRSLLETRQKQLDEATRVLAGDFGLRTAIATGDKPTVASMLENHEKRADGLIVAVHDLREQLLAKSSNLPANQRLDALTLRPEASGRDGQPRINMSSLDAGGRTLFHLSTAEVRAPTRLAWISMGFEIDSQFAEELTRLTGLQFMFLARDRQGAWRQHGSTLPPTVTAAALSQAPRQRGRPWGGEDGGRSWTLPAQADTYLLTALPLSTLGTGEVVVVLGKSLHHAMSPLHQVESMLLYLLVGSLLLSVAAVYWVTVRMVAPINESAHRDTLTGLLNRRSFDAGLRQAVDDARRRATPLFVLMMDLNKFKAINDNLGHAAGDEVLRVVARRLQQGLRSADTVARLGGDEFAVILPGLDRAGAERLIDGVAHAIRQPFPWAGQTLSVGVSIGAADASVAGGGADELLAHADQAMYAAKTSGRAHAFHGEAAPAAAAPTVATTAEVHEDRTVSERRTPKEPVLRLVAV